MRLSTHHVIHKFTLEVEEERDGVFKAEVDLPSSSTVREVAMQGNAVCLWVEVDNEVTGRKTRKFLMVGTGREFDACKHDTYVGTFFDAQWVWHLFEARS
jgi:hypothetical protein